MGVATGHLEYVYAWEGGLGETARDNPLMAAQTTGRAGTGGATRRPGSASAWGDGRGGTAARLCGEAAWTTGRAGTGDAMSQCFLAVAILDGVGYLARRAWAEYALRMRSAGELAEVDAWRGRACALTVDPGHGASGVWRLGTV